MAPCLPNYLPHDLLILRGHQSFLRNALAPHAPPLLLSKPMSNLPVDAVLSLSIHRALGTHCIRKDIAQNGSVKEIVDVIRTYITSYLPPSKYEALEEDLELSFKPDSLQTTRSPYVRSTLPPIRRLACHCTIYWSNCPRGIVSVNPSTPPPSSVKPNDKEIALDAHNSADDEEINSSYHSHPARDILPPLLLWAKPEPDAPSRRSEHLKHQRMCGLERVGGEIGNERRNGKILERLESRAKLSAYPSAVQYSAL